MLTDSPRHKRCELPRSKGIFLGYNAGAEWPGQPVRIDLKSMLGPQQTGIQCASTVRNQVDFIPHGRRVVSDTIRFIRWVETSL